MLKVEIIGNLGADAEIKDYNGSKFVTMRVAHSSKYTDQEGKTHEKTVWVDVTMNNTESKVIPYLKAGTKIFCRGNADLRVYSSPKDRMMKAGLSISTSEIELVGGSSDAVPRELIHPEDGALFKVNKFYAADIDTSKWKKEDKLTLVDKSGVPYIVVKGGWVAPMQPEQEEHAE